MRLPRMGKARDGIYPRCVYCCGENYAPLVIAYSAGEVCCAASSGCGRYIPEDYVVEQPEPEGEDEPVVLGCNLGLEDEPFVIEKLADEPFVIEKLET